MPGIPVAAQRLCAGGCGALVARGRCAGCARTIEQQRGSSSARGYGATWRRFRTRYVAMLVHQGIIPACGASLPGGPQQPTECQAAGLLTVSNLHLDHEPPLTDAERTNPRVVCDPLRVHLLCQREHNQKTRLAETRGGPTNVEM